MVCCVEWRHCLTAVSSGKLHANLLTSYRSVNADRSLTPAGFLAKYYDSSPTPLCRAATDWGALHAEKKVLLNLMACYDDSNYYSGVESYDQWRF